MNTDDPKQPGSLWVKTEMNGTMEPAYVMTEVIDGMTNWKQGYRCDAQYVGNQCRKNAQYKTVIDCFKIESAYKHILIPNAMNQNS